MAVDHIIHRRVETNGIMLNCAEQLPEGATKGLVLMCHGFPESWYSWRHCFAAIAAAGYHAVAVDMPGYGRSDKPYDIDQYNQKTLVDNMIGLIPALGYETAIIMGHDWGAPTAWGAAEWHPDKITAVGILSVPFSPRGDFPPLDMLKQVFKDQFFYQLYFQEPGVAEAELGGDVRTFLRKFIYMGSGEGAENAAAMAAQGPDADLLSNLPNPDEMPAWLTDEDLDYYVSEFGGSGMRGPLNYYRNLNTTWRNTEGAPGVVNQPCMFVAGEKDGVITMSGDAYANMGNHVTDLRINELIPGVGHWTQQEAPEQVNDAITRFLGML